MSKLTFKRTEDSAREIYRKHPHAPATTPAIANAANAALRERWAAEEPLRQNSKGDSFAQFSAHCRKYPHLARLALYTPMVEGVLEDVELEGDE